MLILYNMFKTQIKHKAMHCGYNQKPSKKTINATLLMYMECHNVIKKIEQPNTPTGTQLKLEL